ncbi:hypothetical protein Tco_1018863 [Tanacetum coccineum]|uniref:Reverse transcriptase domain-containing protein n=1 Tax=Tanacetum coccineum TaxID=301880 RepID=A0ABQ5FWX3_9ASTR
MVSNTSQIPSNTTTPDTISIITSTPPLPVSSPVPVLSPSPPASPIRSLGYRAAMIRLRVEAASTSHSLPLPPPFILSHTRPAEPSSGTPPLHLLSTDHREEQTRGYLNKPPSKEVSHDVAYAMTWANLRKKMTDKYCPRNEMKKLEAELMFPKESDKIERYIGGLPYMIHGNIVASKSKTMQEAVEMATELMDKKVSTIAERHAENKRKFENTS